MGNEGGSEDRLTKTEFAELIQHLSVQEILAIEYRVGTVWKMLIVRKHLQGHSFYCNLCCLETSSFKNLLSHIDGRKHKFKMEKVDQLYHYDYTYPKNYKNETLVEEKKLENVNVKDKNTCRTVEKQTVEVQSKVTECSKSLTQTKNQKEVGECTEICENKNKENQTTSLQKDLDKQAKNVEVDAKPDFKAVNANKVSKELKKPVQKVSEKRPFIENSNEKDVALKKPKIVVNPAAVLLLEANSPKAIESEEKSKKPEYQTNKIIVPTVNKKKSEEQTLPALALQPHDNAAPKFATKSYSSKPSDNDVHGILGVEYVIKIMRSRNDLAPRYECGLCELILDGFAMQRHLEGYNHRLKFCEKHFPTAIRQYRQYMQNVPESEIFKVMAPVLAKLAQAIEQHHGRSLPYECFERDYSSNRHEILAKAYSCRHASEQYGPTFTHVIGSKEIDEFITNRHMYTPTPFSRTAIFDAKPDNMDNKSNHRHQRNKITNRDPNINVRENYRHAGRENFFVDERGCRSYMSSNLHNETYAPPLQSYTQTKADGRNDVQPVDDATYNLMVDDFLKGNLKGVSRRDAFRNTRKHLSPPVQNLSSEKRKSLSPLRQDDIWQAYRHLVDQELYALEERFKQYRKEPESHPSYNEEWQKFWKRRKDELVSAGIDHRSYNYQPEWVRFVKIRIEELYYQEVENVKIKSRERLCLPMSNENIKDAKYHVKPEKPSLSNVLIENEYKTQQNPVAACSKAPQTWDSNAPQVVSVLRLMTALEDSLGSLGPKIIDLLSKALQTEKINPLHVNDIILNDDNCSLIETAKEKLKALVITGLFEGSKQKVLNQVVTDAEALLQYAYQFKKELPSKRSSIEFSINQSQNSSSFTRDNISSNASHAFKNQPGASTSFNKTTPSPTFTDNLPARIDKKELASKLAASLVAQGRTEFDSSQLQKLVAVYKLIEKKKRESAAMAETAGHNKNYSQDSSSISKKTLSDTLADLLKPSSSSSSSSSSNVVSDVYNNSQASNARAVASNSNLHSFAMPGTFTNNAPSNPFTSVQQNPRDNFFNSTARSMSNLYGANNVQGNLTEHQSNYAQNYGQNLQSNQPNFSTSNSHTNQFQNNSRMTQNWGWSSNMNVNQNYNMGNSNHGMNQNSGWQPF